MLFVGFVFACACAVVGVVGELVLVSFSGIDQLANRAMDLMLFIALTAMEPVAGLGGARSVGEGAYSDTGVGRGVSVRGGTVSVAEVERVWMEGRRLTVFVLVGGVEVTGDARRMPESRELKRLREVGSGASVGCNGSGAAPREMNQLIVQNILQGRRY